MTMPSVVRCSLASLLAVGCVSEQGLDDLDADSGVADDDSGAPAFDGAAGFGVDPEPAAIGTVRTIAGDVYFDDFRKDGRFSLRKTKAGATATQVDYTGTGHNYVGGLDMEVRVYEIDPADDAVHDCERVDLWGIGHVQADGHFAVVISDDDACLIEDDDPDIAVSISLSYCDDVRCFSTRVDDGEPYLLYYPTASISSPQAVSGTFLDLGTRYFEKNAYDDFAKAASLFAAEVDATRKLNVEAGIVNALDDEIIIEFPDDVDSASTNGTTVHMPAPAAGEWIGGGGAIHEFGHAFHARSWGGGIAACSTNTTAEFMRDGHKSWSLGSREWPNVAFNEGVANFIERAVLEGYNKSCTANGFDPNSDPGDPSSIGNPIYTADPDEYPAEDVACAHPNDGKSYAGNVHKLMCDWFDAVGDDDSHLAGSGDHFTASLASTWQNIAEMYTETNNHDCLDVCSVVDYYLDVRKSVAAVGQASHDAYVADITDLVFQNGITCGLTAP